MTPATGQNNAPALCRGQPLWALAGLMGRIPTGAGAGLEEFQCAQHAVDPRMGKGFRMAQAVAITAPGLSASLQGTAPWGPILARNDSSPGKVAGKWPDRQTASGQDAPPSRPFPHMNTAAPNPFPGVTARLSGNRGRCGSWRCRNAGDPRDSHPSRDPAWFRKGRRRICRPSSGSRHAGGHASP